MRAPAIATAFREVRKHPWRSFLACQGVAWAVTMVVLPGSIVTGTRAASLERAEELGTSYIEITPDRAAIDAEIPREADLEALRAAVDDSVSLAPLRAKAVRSPGLQEFVWLLGTTAELAMARRVEVLDGRFPTWSPSDGALSSEVALESRLAGHLFGTDSPVGRSIVYEAEPAPGFLRRAGPQEAGWEVVGVISDATSRKVDIQGFDDDHFLTDDVRSLQRSFGVVSGDLPFLESGLGCYVSLSTVPGDKTPVLFVHCPPLLVEEVAKRIESELVARGRRPLSARNAVWNILLKPELEGFMSIHDVVSGIYLGIGLLIMTNLLLLSGRQRRREIALRRAEGATRRDVFLQFICEGFFLTVLGVIGGVPMGLLLGYLRIQIDPNVSFGLTMPWLSLAKAMVWIALGTLAASAYPAWRATLYHPMAILRRDAMT